MVFKPWLEQILHRKDNPLNQTNQIPSFEFFRVFNPPKNDFALKINTSALYQRYGIFEQINSCPKNTKTAIFYRNVEEGLKISLYYFHAGNNNIGTNTNPQTDRHKRRQKRVSQASMNKKRKKRERRQVVDKSTTHSKMIYCQGFLVSFLRGGLPDRTFSNVRTS